MYVKSFIVILVVAYANQCLADSESSSPERSHLDESTIKTTVNSSHGSSQSRESVTDFTNQLETSADNIQNSQLTSAPQDLAENALPQAQTSFSEAQNLKQPSMPPKPPTMPMGRPGKGLRNPRNSNWTSTPQNLANYSTDRIRGLRSSSVRSTMNQEIPTQKISIPTADQFTNLLNMPVESEQDMENLIRELENVTDKMYEQEKQDIDSWSQVDMLSPYQSQVQEALSLATGELKKTIAETLSSVQNSISEVRNSMNPEQLKEFLNEMRQSVVAETAPARQYFSDTVDGIRDITSEVGGRASNLMTNSMSLAKSLPQQALSGTRGAASNLNRPLSFFSTV